MLSARLFKPVVFLFTFTWVFFLSTIFLTINTAFIYISKMFDLPYDVITAINVINEMRNSNEDIDEKIPK